MTARNIAPLRAKSTLHTSMSDLNPLQLLIAGVNTPHFTFSTWDEKQARGGQYNSSLGNLLESNPSPKVTVVSSLWQGCY